MKNITFEGISTLQRLHLCWQIRKQIGKIHQPIEMGAAAGFEMAPITWTQKQKGVDDLYRHLFRDK